MQRRVLEVKKLFLDVFQKELGVPNEFAEGGILSEIAISTLPYVV